MPGGAGDVRREAQPCGRHAPHDVADVIRRPSGLLAVGNQLPAAQRLRDLGRQAALGRSHRALKRARELLIGVAPLRHADRRRCSRASPRDRLVAVLRPRAAEHARAHRRIGHDRRGVRHPVPDRPEVLDLVEVVLAEVIPDRRVGRDDVRLVAAVADDVVRPLREPEMLAAEVPPDVHQLHGVERAPAAPRRAGGVRALALEAVLHRHHAAAAGVAPRCPERAADVGVEDGVHVLEDSRAHEIRLGRQQLLGDARPQHQRAGDLLALHDLLGGERGRHDHRLTAVVSLAMPRRAGHELLARDDSRRLVRRRQAVDVGPEGDHRPPRTPRRDPRRRHVRRRRGARSKPSFSRIEVT